MLHSKLTYQQSGVDYSKIDPLKILAQRAAKETANNLLAAGFHEIEASRLMRFCFRNVASGLTKRRRLHCPRASLISP